MFHIFSSDPVRGWNQRRKIMKRLSLFIVFVSLLGFLSTAIANEARDKVGDAIEVIKEIQSIPEKGIPAKLLKESVAIAIFPGVIKAGFIVGGKYGKGVILHHKGARKGWSPPAFFSIAGGSFGFQIGGQSTDLILVIRNERGLKGLLRSEFTLGGDASVAAGPVGRKAEAAVDISLKAEIYAYSRSRGLFAGLSLEGAKLNSLEKMNKSYYRKKLTAQDILLNGKAIPPKSALSLMDVMNSYTK